MNVRSVATLGLGLVLAGVAVYAVNHRLSQQPEPGVAQAFPVTPVVVAAQAIEFGARLDNVSLKVTSFPADTTPEETFRTTEELLGDGTQARVALKSFAAGEPILSSRVSGFGGRATMSNVLPDGKRAFTIKVNEVTGVAGFLLPGDRVDVLLTRPTEGMHRIDQVSDVILQNIAVRGIDQISEEDRNKPVVVRAVTLEVTPEESQKLALAQQVGQLSLALRNVASLDVAPTRTISVGDLSAGPHPVVQPAVKENVNTAVVRKPLTVRVRRGTETETVKFGG